MAEENEIGGLHLAVDEESEKARELWKKYGVVQQDLVHGLRRVRHEDSPIEIRSAD